MKSSIGMTAIVLALTVTTPALATETPSDESAHDRTENGDISPSVAKGTNAPDRLPLRPEKPLVLASEPRPLHWSYKLLFVSAVAGAGWIAWRRRKGTPNRTARASELSIRGRASVGMRAEVAIVQAGSTQILIGITPSAIQTLAVLPDDAEADERLSDVAAEGPSTLSTISDRAQALFAAREPSSSARTTGAGRYADIADDGAKERDRRRPRPDVAGQARGLLLALRGNDESSHR